MRSAAGDLGRPGIVIISPVRTTTKPAPADTLTFLMVTVKSVGAPSFVASSEKDYCVFAIHTGTLSKPSAVSAAICFLAAGRTEMPLPP